MEKITLRKIQELFLFFLFVSIIGWCYEVFLDVVVYQSGYSDRGILIGPYCVVYGFGAVILLLCLQKFLHKKTKIGNMNLTPLLVFFSIVLISTIVEWIASYIMEWMTGSFMWNYDRFWMNFEGRIAPNPSIRFGIGGMLIFYFLYPYFKNITNKLSNKKLSNISIVLIAVFLTEFIFLILTKVLHLL